MVAVYRFAALLAAWALLLTTSVPMQAKTRKGDKFIKDGEKAEARKDYDAALALYEQALETDYSEIYYQLLVRRARAGSAQTHVDKGRKMRASGQIADALVEFQRAFTIDPGSSIAEQELKRTHQMLQRDTSGGNPEEKGLTPADLARKQTEERLATLASVPELKPVSRQITNLKMNNQPARVLFETVGKLAGVNVLFDPDFVASNQGKNFTLDLTNSTIQDGLDYLSLLTKAFWKPISANAIFITQDQQQKRRDFEDNVVKVFYLQNVTAPQELNEIAAALRTITEIRRLLTYNAQMAILVRGTADAVTLAQKLIHDLDKPKSEVVVDVSVMEVNRVKTRTLMASLTNGSTPGLNVPVIFTPGGSIPSNGEDTSTTPQGYIPLSRLGRLSTNDFSITLPGGLVQAIVSDRNTRVLQNPQLRALDLQKADLKIGDRYPYATGSFQPGVGTVGVSPLVSTQFQFADVGVNVSVTPKIHSAEEVSMHVEIEVSNIRDKVNVGGLEQPVIGQRKVTQDIRVREGEATIIGGLTGLIRTKNSDGIPGAATSGIGWLLGRQSSEVNQNELLIVMTPRIVRSPDISTTNLREIAVGNETVVKLSYQREGAPAAAVPPAAAPQSGAPAPAKPETPKTEPSKPSIPSAGKLTFSPAAPVAAVGSTIEIALEVEGVNDLFAAPFRVVYPKELLKLVEVERGPVFAGNPVSFTRDVNTGTVRVSRLPGAPGISGGGQLAILRFQALAKGEAKVTLQDLLLQDSKLQPITAPAPEVSVRVQ